MKKQLLLLPALCLMFTACDNTSTSTPNADNTARNARDRNGQTLTPGDQLENEADRGLTQKIRQSLMDDDSLSTNAKNVKIITVNGVVTLRGTVNSDREKNEIGKKAKSVSGVRSVDNQIEIIRTDTAPGHAPDNRDLNR